MQQLRRDQSLFIQYVLVTSSVVLAAVARVLLRPFLGGGTSVAFITIYPAVIYSAWTAGLGGGLVATALAALLAVFFILTAQQPFGVLDSASEISLIIFVMAGTAISLLGQAQHKARREAKIYADEAVQSARLAQEHIQGLQESEAVKTAMLTAALDAIITIDDHQHVLEWNRAAEQTFGYLRDEALGRDLSHLIIPPPLRGAHERGMKHFRETGKGSILNKRIEVPARRKGDSEFPAELTVTPIDIGGRILFTAYVRDLTERERAAAQQQAFLRDVLRSVTEGHLRLCYSAPELPAPLALHRPPISLSEADGIAKLRHSAGHAAQQNGFDEARSSDLITATSEAAMNAFVHAGGGEGRVCSDPNTLQVWITDQGKGIDIARLPRATLEKGYSSAGTLGHGMKLMLATTDRVWLMTGTMGTTVALEIDRIAPQPENII